MAWQDEVAQQRQDVAKSEDIYNRHNQTLEAISSSSDSIIKVLKKLSAIELGDSPETNDKLTKIIAILEQHLSRIPSEELQLIIDLLHKIISVEESKNNDSLVKQLQSLEKSVNSIKLPKITVPKQIIDTKPISDVFEKYYTPSKKIDLSDYKAQDLREDGDIQYIGFLNPSGDWYIMENDMKQNTLRYIFGSKKYAQAFKKAASYKYELLNKAIHEI